MKAKLDNVSRRKLRIRKKVSGTEERPRLSVFRSAKHIYAQIINDASGQTILTVSSVSKKDHEQKSSNSKTDVAKLVGAKVAQVCLKKNILKVVFDRNGYLYHGRIKALADAAREAGLQF